MLKALFFMCLFAAFSFNSSAQFMGGIGASYGDDIQQFAPNLRLYYFPNHKICLGPELAYFPTIEEKGIKKELMEYGFSGHYIFPLSEHLAFYPLVGLNFAIETKSHQDVVEEVTSFGANLGAGFHLECGRYFPYAEYKYVASALAQNVFSIGLLINIPNPKKESNTEH